MINEFAGFPKIPRLNREIVITEKIDGTNAQVVIKRAEGRDGEQVNSLLHTDGHYVFAGSRNRWLNVDNPRMTDNFGFAAWVKLNAPQLISLLGEGQHFGEWWGAGIQRTYGLQHKRFSLFNVDRWGWLADERARQDRGIDFQLHVVPELYRGPRTVGAEGVCAASMIIEDLRHFGSRAAPLWMDPEGIIVFHTAARQMYKVTVKDDASPKGQRV